MVESHAMFSIVSALHASNEASAKIADAVQAKNPDTDPGLTELTSSLAVNSCEYNNNSSLTSRVHTLGHTDIPLEVSTDSKSNKQIYMLPLRQNRGKPPNMYSLEGNVRYSIANYVSTHRLSPKYCVLVQRMETIKIPTKVEEALRNPKWTEAMQVEIEALQKNKTWRVVTLPKEKKLVGANGCSPSNIRRT
ncbi:hypothetical protein ACFX1T_047111 [Malus domestica]